MTNHDGLQYIEYFLEMMMAERGAANNTIISYRQDLLDFHQFIAKQNIAYKNIDAALLHKYLSFLAASGAKTTTLARKISSIRSFMKFLLEEEIFSENPAQQLELPKRERPLPKALSQQEITNILEIAAKDASAEGVRLVAMLEILYATGMRISELVELQLGAMQHNPQNGELLSYMIIRGKGGKERMVVVHEQAAEWLLKYLAVRNSFLKKGHKSLYLFPSYGKKGNLHHISRQRFGQLLKGLAIASGIAPERLSPHKIRHSFASHLLQNGANLRSVQALLGHADISSTQIYTKVFNEDNYRLVTSKHPLAGGE